MTNLIKVTERIHILGRSVSRDEARKIWKELDKIFGDKVNTAFPYYPPGVRGLEIEPCTPQPYIKPELEPVTEPWRIVFGDNTMYTPAQSFYEDNTAGVEY